MQCLPFGCARGPTSTTSRASDGAAATAGSLPGDEPQPPVRRQRHGKLGQLRLQRHRRSQRHVLREESYQTTGNLPRVNLSRGERPHRRQSPLYFGVNGEYVIAPPQRHAGNRRQNGSGADATRRPLRLLRIPFTKWSFLTANSSSRGVAPTGPRASRTLRRWRNRSAENTSTCRRGSPVRSSSASSTRPGSGFAEKIKHVIEPSFTIQRVTAIDNCRSNRQARWHGLRDSGT